MDGPSISSSFKVDQIKLFNVKIYEEIKLHNCKNYNNVTDYSDVSTILNTKIFFQLDKK